MIGGVITSTLLTLLVIPTFYEIMTEWRDWLLGKLTGKKHAHGHGHGEPALGAAHRAVTKPAESHSTSSHPAPRGGEDPRPLGRRPGRPLNYRPRRPILPVDREGR